MKIQLKETQVKNLLKGYKILSEQSEIQGFDPITKTESVNFSSVWETGKYNLTSSQISKINNELSKVVTFLRENPLAKLNIEIVAGESQVTNYDREKCPGSEFTSECSLKPGVLSNNRAKSIYDYLLKYFQELKKNNVIKTLPNKPTIKTVIGKTSYTKGKDKASDPRYTQEQFVRLNISAAITYECLVGMDIKISYEKGGKHQCDEAIFALKVNGVPLGVANLNNATYDVNGMFDIKSYIEKYNRKLANEDVKKIASKLYVPFRNSRKGIGDWTVSSDELNINGKASDLGFKRGDYQEFYSFVLKKYMETDFKGKFEYSPDVMITEKMVKKTNLTRLKYFIGKTIGEVEEIKDFADKLKNIEGRETDNTIGGYRSQTFRLDEEKAREIVNKASVKDKLIFTIVPLVDKTGPYKLLYSSGSHSDVPKVTITGKNGDVRYEGTPNIEMGRGSTSETFLTQTDLCGNPIETN